MAEVEVRVPVETFRGSDPEIVELLVDDGSLFVEAVLIALGHAGEAAREGSLYLFFDGEPMLEEEYRYSNFIEVEHNNTVAEVLRVVDGEPYRISFGGWGGDALWVEGLLRLSELIGLGLTIHGAWSLAKDGRTTVQELRWRRERRLAEVWRDSEDQEDIPLALTQAVRAKRAWYRRRFDYTFGLEGESGTRLLRAHGYRRVENDRDVVWIEAGSPDKIADDIDYMIR